jgi:hypothetical protein
MDENGYLLPDSHSIFNRCKNFFCQVLNVHGVNDVRQTEMHTAKPLAPKLSPFKAEIATEKLIRYKLPGIDKIQAELIQAGGNTLHSEKINKLINSTEITKNCHSTGRYLLLYLSIKRAIKLNVVIVEGYHCYQLHIKFYPIFLS